MAASMMGQRADQVRQSDVYQPTSEPPVSGTSGPNRGGKLTGHRHSNQQRRRRIFALKLSRLQKTLQRFMNSPLAPPSANREVTGHLHPKAQNVTARNQAHSSGTMAEIVAIDDLARLELIAAIPSLALAIVRHTPFALRMLAACLLDQLNRGVDLHLVKLGLEPKLPSGQLTGWEST
jgi:hypothetical protein